MVFNLLLFFFSQEPYSTFSEKVSKLLIGLFPESKEESLALERLEGGGYNRAIGATLAGGTRCIVRIPRFEAILPDLEHHTATLAYLLKDPAGLPVPKVLAYDSYEGDDDNVIDLPYMVETLMPGQPLEEVYRQMNLEEKTQIVLEVAKIMRKFDSIRFNQIGTIRSVPEGWTPSEKEYGIRIGPWAPEPDDPVNIYIAPGSSASFLRQRLKIRSNYPDMETIDKFAAIAYHFTQKTFPEGPYDHISLYYKEFEPHNILVDKDANGSWHISGLLEMETATAAPLELARGLPYWLWTWGFDADSDDESDSGSNEDWEDDDGHDHSAVNLPELYLNPRHHDNDPINPDAHKLKDVFEAEIDKLIPGYMEYWKANTAMRELLYFAIEGISTELDELRAQAFIKSMEGVVDFELYSF